MNQNTDYPKREQGAPGRPAHYTEKKKNGRHRWLFLLVDVLLILAILAAVFFIVSLLTPFPFSKKDKAEIRTVSYTVELTGVSSATLNALHVGDTVTNAETGAAIGTVKAVDVRPYETFGERYEYDSAVGSNVVTRITYPDTLNTVSVTIEASAAYVANRGYTANGCRIAVGMTYTLLFPEYTGSGVCVSLVK